MLADAHAQSPQPANGENALLENDQVKVREMQLPPGAHSAATSHPNTFLYALTDGSLVFSPPGHTPYEFSFKAGEALWLPAQSTATANESGKEIRLLVVELKARAAPPPKPKAKAAAKTKTNPKANPKTKPPSSAKAKSKPAG